MPATQARAPSVGYRSHQRVRHGVEHQRDEDRQPAQLARQAQDVVVEDEIEDVERNVEAGFGRCPDAVAQLRSDVQLLFQPSLLTCPVPATLPPLLAGVSCIVCQAYCGPISSTPHRNRTGTWHPGRSCDPPSRPPLVSRPRPGMHVGIVAEPGFEVSTLDEPSTGQLPSDPSLARRALNRWALRHGKQCRASERPEWSTGQARPCWCTP